MILFFSTLNSSGDISWTMSALLSLLVFGIFLISMVFFPRWPATTARSWLISALSAASLLLAPALYPVAVFGRKALLSPLFSKITGSFGSRYPRRARELGLGWPAA